jgi:deferrochelatase/peroxidase EfeB
VTHFGYRDGLSQPTIDGAPMAGIRDPLPPVPAGDIVLGHPSARVGFAYPVPQPEPLGRNGSFGAFRVLAQDVAGFHRFLADEAAALGIDPELLAAKVCGRWRNGVPVLMSPGSATPDPPVPHDRLNDFDYVRTAAQQEFDDPRGDVCPVGSHIRRANPRNARVAGGGLKRRIVRRGLTYGPPYDPALPDDQERGLVGMFIGADLQEGFEFVVGEWLNGGTFAAGLHGSKDVLAGANEPTDSRFVVSRRPRVAVSGFSRFVTTRGAAYCFLPSMTGLRVLAGGG